MKLYYTESSPPCKTVILVADILGIKLDLVVASPKNGQTRTPEYLKMNPQHVIPTFVDDDGYIVWESRTICKYLICKYAPNSTLYPKDLHKRTEVDKILDFDLGTFFRRISDYFVGIFVNGKFDETKKPKCDDACNVLENILKQSKFGYVAGDCLTIADISLIVIVAGMEVVGYDYEQFPHVRTWMKKVKSSIPNYKTLGEAGETAFRSMYLQNIK